MRSIIKKLLKFNVLIIGLALSSQVYAQQISPIEVLSYKEFVKKHNIEGLYSQDSDKTIFCGDKETTCNRKTEICLRCSFYKSGGAISGGSKAYIEEGKCVSRIPNHPDDYDKQEIRLLADQARFCLGEINTELENVVGKIKGFAFGNTKKQLFYEKNGFIGAKTVRLGLFINVKLQNDQFCEAGDNDKCYKLIYDSDNNASLAYASDTKKNIAEGCEVLPIKINSMRSCFFCPLAKVVFESANSLTQLSFDRFSSPFMSLMVIAFAIWLALTSLKTVFTFTKQDGNKYLSGIIAQAGKFLFAYLLLAYPDELFRLFISPVLQAGIDMSQGLLIATNSNSGFSATSVASSGLFDADALYEKIEKFLTNVQTDLATMQAIGTSLFCVGGHQMMIENISDVFHLKSNISYGIQMMGLGLILFIFSFILTISFAFYFIDALLQLAILGAMLPFMIAGWPFKITANYSRSGLGMLLNTFFTLFFTGFIVTVELNLINSTLNELNNTRLTPESDAGLFGLFKAINEQDTDAIQDIVSVGGGGYLLLIFASLFGFKFIKETPKITNKLAGGLNLGVSSKVGTMGASAATGVAKKATKPIRKMAAESYHARGGLMGAAGRALQMPAKIASGIKQSSLGQFISNTAVGKGLEKTRTSVQGFGSSLGQKIGDFGDKMLNKGDANIHTDKTKGIVTGMGQKVLGKLAQKVGGGIHHVSQEGLLNATGQNIEKFAKKVHKDFSDAEQRAEQREHDVEKFKEKYGRDPKRGELPR